MKLTMSVNHWAEAMFRKFAGSIADHGVIAAANDGIVPISREEKECRPGRLGRHFRAS
jgi:hypothetical protein